MKATDFYKLVWGDEYINRKATMEEHLQLIKDKHITHFCDYDKTDKPARYYQSAAYMYTKFPNIKVRLRNMGWTQQYY